MVMRLHKSVFYLWFCNRLWHHLVHSHSKHSSYFIITCH
jgi:hypothetical protein